MTKCAVYVDYLSFLLPSLLFPLSLFAPPVDNSLFESSSQAPKSRFFPVGRVWMEPDRYCKVEELLKLYVELVENKDSHKS